MDVAAVPRQGALIIIKGVEDRPSGPAELQNFLDVGVQAGGLLDIVPWVLALVACRREGLEMAENRPGFGKLPCAGRNRRLAIAFNVTVHPMAFRPSVVASAKVFRMFQEAPDAVASLLGLPGGSNGPKTETEESVALVGSASCSAHHIRETPGMAAVPARRGTIGRRPIRPRERTAQR